MSQGIRRRRGHRAVEFSFVRFVHSAASRIMAWLLIISLPLYGVPVHALAPTFSTREPLRATAGLPAVLESIESEPAPTSLLYVNNTDPTCQGQAAPCYSSIQAAIDDAHPGDTIRIQAGTYVEQLVFRGKNRKAATEAERLVLEADPAAPVGSVVLEGAKKHCANGFAVLFAQSKFITLRGLTITGAGGQAIWLPGGIDQNRAIHIERNRIVGNGSVGCNGGISVSRGNPDTVILNNLLYGNGQNGLSFFDEAGGPHYVVQNTIVRNGWNGVTVGRLHRLVLLGNLIVHNGTAPGIAGGRVGVWREGTTGPRPADILLLSNLLCGNRLGEIGGPVLDDTDEANGTPQGNEGPGVSARPGCQHASTLWTHVAGPDGQLNTLDDDFTLLLTSPALDAGIDPRNLGLPITNSPYAIRAKKV